jgi:hypothetical protein
VLGALVFVLGLQAFARASSGDVRLHWGSEDLIQTLPIVDLRNEPLASLWYLHVQPPGLALVRAALARVADDPDPATLALDVDRGIVALWSVAYAITGALLLWWLRLLVPRWCAGLGALAFLLHPAALLYTTVPDTTMPTALFLTWSVYELWRLARGHGSIPRLALSLLALFLVRSMFQWPAVLVYVAGLLLLGVERRRVVAFIALTVPFIAAYAIKQYALFGLTTTTSFVGYNCMRSIGLLPYGYGPGEHVEVDQQEIRAELGDTLAYRVVGALRREAKITGVQNFNHVKYLVYGRSVLEGCRSEYASRSWSLILSAYADNLGLYLFPSSGYGNRQPLLEYVPWRRAWDIILSGPLLVGLVGAAAAAWLRRAWRQPRAMANAATWRRAWSVLRVALGVTAPVLMVVAASILFERGENMRFRFFIEPLVLVLLVSQACGAGSPSRGGGSAETPAPSAEAT